MLLQHPRGSVYWLKDYNTGAKGSEQNGTRPVLIVSNDKNNMHSTVVTVVPITSREKNTLPTHVTISSIKPPYQETNLILCEQINTISKVRLTEYIGMLTPDIMAKVEEAMSVQLGLKTSETTLVNTSIEKETPQYRPGSRGFVGYSDEYKQAYLKDAEKMTNAQLAKKYQINAKAASARKISWAKQINKS